MSEAFDPYHRWLGIPPKDQPPHHYRLLGLDLFESDDEVIADAVQRQMAHVRTYQLGPNSAVAQAILNQLGAAKACLLNPEKKAIYDERLRQAPSAKTAVVAPPAVQPPASFPPPAPAARPPVPTAVPPRPPASTRPWRFAMAAAAGGILLGLVVGTIVLLGAKRRNAPPEPVPATHPELKGSGRSLALAPSVQPAKRVEPKPAAVAQPHVETAQPAKPESPRPSASKPAPSQNEAAAPAKPAPLPAANVVAKVAPPLPSPGPPPPKAAEPVRIAGDDAGTAPAMGRLPKPELEIVFEPGGVLETAGHLRFVVSGKIAPVMGLGRNTAGRFDNACITLDPLEMGRSPFTVEVLARPGKSIGTAQMFLCWQKSKDRDAFYFARRADGVRVAYPTESGAAKVDWPVDYRPGQWYHLAAVRDGEGVYVYVNGEKAFAGKPAIADLPTSAYPFTIGNNTLRHAQYTGDLQFVRLYRAALTPQQIRIRAMLALGGKR